MARLSEAQPAARASDKGRCRGLVVVNRLVGHGSEPPPIGPRLEGEKQGYCRNSSGLCGG